MLHFQAITVIMLSVIRLVIKTSSEEGCMCS